MEIKNSEPQQNQHITQKQHEAWLSEYQVCEEDNAANFQGYWTLAAIFIGVSPVFLGGLVFAVIANDSLFSVIFCQNEPPKILAVGIIAIIIGIAMIVILNKLRGWHRRILQNQEINSARMREIELELNMNRSWRTHSLNIWYEQFSKEPTDNYNHVWEKLKPELECGLSPAVRGRINELENRIVEQIQIYFPKGTKKKSYEPPSSKKHYPCILFTLATLWILVIAVAVFLIITAYFW